ncbi:hypothetical protein BMI86_10355 [Thioclava sp. DLFJ5-1]|nr:hypothetical protein BMI86_10355 [Thioclava sp. DLFJ5-1]
MEQSTPVIAQNEGERLVAYLPTPIDRPTICFGSTKGVRLGDTATHEECIALLAEEVRTYWFGLKPYFSSDTLLYRLTLLRAVAYLDTAYNCGVSAIGHSTAMRRLNAGNVRGGCTALGWWNKQGGRVVRGLVIRRKKAVRSCMVGVE